MIVAVCCYICCVRLLSHYIYLVFLAWALMLRYWLVAYPICRSVCLSVCLSVCRSVSPHWLIGSGCHLGWWVGSVEGWCIRWGTRAPRVKGGFGFFCPNGLNVSSPSCSQTEHKTSASHVSDLLRLDRWYNRSVSEKTGKCANADNSNF